MADLLRRFRRRTWAERLAFGHAALLYGAVAAGLRFLPFGPMLAALRRAYPLAVRADWSRAHRSIWAVTTAGALMPVTDRCLVEAVAGHCLIRRAGVATEIRFGVAAVSRRSGPPILHAWVASGEAVLIDTDRSRAWQPLSAAGCRPS